jgi:hypothetical protein
MKMKKWPSIILAVAGALSVGGVARAGYHELQPVGVSKGSDGAGYSWGHMGDATAAADGIQYLQCGVWYWAGGAAHAVCYSRDANGNNAYCVSAEPAAVQTVAALTSDAQVEYYFDGKGNCTGIQVYAASYTTPKR